jgi:hypothetical protein
MFPVKKIVGTVEMGEDGIDQRGLSHGQTEKKYPCSFVFIRVPFIFMC